ncbi:hypothetical protein QWZ10_07765 [Paracoccus cavernae]|nr:hypothetical protein [Paracoccus cavernae]
MLTQLTRSDLIRTYASDEKALPLYETSTLTDFMASLERLREPGLPENGWLEIPTAAHRAKITTATAVSLIFLHMLPLRCPRREISGFRDPHVDVATLREAISLPEEGAVHPRRAAKILDVPAATIAAMLQRGHLDSIPVPRPSPGPPVLYVCPTAVTSFSNFFVTKNQAMQQMSGRHTPAVIEQLLEEYRINFSTTTEPIYRSDVLAEI